MSSPVPESSRIEIADVQREFGYVESVDVADGAKAREHPLPRDWEDLPPEHLSTGPGKEEAMRTRGNGEPAEDQQAVSPLSRKDKPRHGDEEEEHEKYVEDKLVDDQQAVSPRSKKRERRYGEEKEEQEKYNEDEPADERQADTVVALVFR
ncbi:MAG: hypothetical protein Q9160_003904 [Pyrenula sp. 1 TL-2023]